MKSPDGSTPILMPGVGPQEAAGGKKRRPASSHAPSADIAPSAAPERVSALAPRDPVEVVPMEGESLALPDDPSLPSSLPMIPWVQLQLVVDAISLSDLRETEMAAILGVSKSTLNAILRHGAESEQSAYRSFALAVARAKIERTQRRVRVLEDMGTKTRTVKKVKEIYKPKFVLGEDGESMVPELNEDGGPVMAKVGEERYLEEVLPSPDTLLRLIAMDQKSAPVTINVISSGEEKVVGADVAKMDDRELRKFLDGMISPQPKE